MVRDGLSMLVALIDGVEVVGAASDGEEALQLAEAHRPDVVLMDLRMPGMDGITATGQLRQRIPATRVLVLTTYADDATILPALRAGALGYLTKDASAEQIEAAIRAVHAGQTHLDPAVQEHLVAAVTSRAAGPTRGAAASRQPPAGLTTREAEVPGPARRRPQQRRDRPAPVRQQRHREDPHQPDLRQDRRPRPRPGRPLRLPDRPGQPTHLTTRQDRDPWAPKHACARSSRRWQRLAGVDLAGGRSSVQVADRLLSPCQL